LKFSFFRDGDGHGHNSEAESTFDLDQGDKQGQPQIQVMLEVLARMESTISQIRNYSFSLEKSQWNKDDEFDAFLNPPQGLWNLDNPQLRLSL
jgi:hypothetical protein